MQMKLMVVLGSLLLAGRAGADEQPSLRTPKDKVDYAIGVEMGRNFRNQGVEVNLDLVVQGLKDDLSGGNLLIPEKELNKIMISFQNELRQKKAVGRRVAAMDNQKKGAAFLAENGTKPGVTTLPSGLQYKILKAGGGRKPTERDTVECNYRGTHLDGTEFDSSVPGQPPVLKLSTVIPGWREALKLMTAGSRWQLFIPPQFAYGERGKGNTIEPNETLIFEIELLAVK
jgi:FKBP-type peptidyl-prolyl cis-trans isomerase FklB